MYSHKLAAAIKVNGKVLREFKDTAYIPFGSEYTILIKNLNTVRAVVNIFIDGDNVVPGGLVVNAGQEIDLERSIKNGNLTEGNKFKFIERTGAVEQHRGVKLEDGLIRIEYQFEQPPVRINDLPEWQKKQIWDGIKYGEFRGATDKYSTTSTTSWLQASGASYSQVNVNGALRGIDYSNGESVKASAAAAVNNYCAQNGIVAQSEIHDGMATMDACFNDVGITVPGSKSTQTFSTVHMGQMETAKYSMVIRLLGETPDNIQITKPVTVKHKPKCVTCGKQNKAHAKFCTECGTALEIFA
jgi:hypothetical protein